MSAPAIGQCGTVCEWHWFDTDPEHIHQPPQSLVDQQVMEQRRISWVKDGAPNAVAMIDAIGPDNPRATLFMFMQSMSRTEIRKIAEVVATSGDPDTLEYPGDYLAEILRGMDDETAAEAWDLFGQGVKP